MVPRSRLLVLVVDSNAQVCERIVALLNLFDFIEVAWAAAGASTAVPLVPLLAPDVVIVDLGMPPGDGLEVLRLIKRQHRRPEVIVLTNLCDDPYRRRCLEAGADYFLDKSREFDEVPVVLQRLWESAASRNGKPRLKATETVEAP